MGKLMCPEINTEEHWDVSSVTKSPCGCCCSFRDTGLCSPRADAHEKVEMLVSGALLEKRLGEV